MVVPSGCACAIWSVLAANTHSIYYRRDDARSIKLYKIVFGHTGRTKALQGDMVGGGRVDDGIDRA